MNKKMACLIKHSLKKKLKTKWFVIVNVLIAILIISLANIDRIIGFFGGDFENKTNILVVDNAGVFASFKNYFQENSKLVEDVGNYDIKLSKEDINKLEKNIKKDDIILNIENSSDNYLQAKVISFDSISLMDSQLISTSLNNIKDDYVLEKSGLTESEIAALTSNVKIEKKVTNPDKDTYKDSEYKDLLSTGIITLFIVPFFIFITTLVQMLGAEINDEKTSRGMEIIISSVPPKTHFKAKIIAALSFVLIQSFLLLGYGLLGLLVRVLLSSSVGSINNVVSGYVSKGFAIVKNSGLIDVLLEALPIIIILFIISFIAYAILAAVLASITTNIEDYQQLQTPLMMIIVASYLLAIMASTFDGALFIKIMAFVPFISVLLAPVLFILGEISLLSLGITTVIMFIFTWILYYFGIKIYKVGILNYSSSNLWQKMFKSLKKEGK